VNPWDSLWEDMNSSDYEAVNIIIDNWKEAAGDHPRANMRDWIGDDDDNERYRSDRRSHVMIERVALEMIWAAL
jgi:hypothetical protein